MPCNVHTLVWDTDNINFAIRHDVKDEMSTFGEAKISRLDVIPVLAGTGIFSQPIQASENRTGVGVSLFQVPFGERIEPELFQVC